MEIVPGIHLIEGITAHCYLVDDAELTLIDTGMPHHSKQILEYITCTLKKDPSDLKTIILTHCDMDHIGNALKLRNITNAKIAAHPQDAAVIAGEKPRVTSKSGMSILFRIFGVFLRLKPFRVDMVVEEGDIVSGLRVIHMPGHTNGSIALYDAKRKVLFVGDALGFRNGAVQPPSKSVASDIQQAYQSVEKLKDLDFTVMLSGHGEPVRDHASVKIIEFINKIKNKNATR
jgi:hydroxyacylglutathione hydrolase